MKALSFGTLLSAPSFEVVAPLFKWARDIILPNKEIFQPDLGVMLDRYFEKKGIAPNKTLRKRIVKRIIAELPESVKEAAQRNALWAENIVGRKYNSRSFWAVSSYGVSLYTLKVDGKEISLDGVEEWFENRKKSPSRDDHIEIQELAAFSIHSFWSAEWEKEEIPVDWWEFIYGLYVLTPAFEPLHQNFLFQSYGAFMPMLLKDVRERFWELEYPLWFLLDMREEGKEERAAVLNKGEAKIMSPLYIEDFEADVISLVFSSSSWGWDIHEILPRKNPYFLPQNSKYSMEEWVKYTFLGLPIKIK